LRRDIDLLDVVQTLGAPGRFAGLLNGGQKQRGEDADDRHDNQEFDQRKAAMERSLWTTPTRIVARMTGHQTFSSFVIGPRQWI
jgi:hypothetical protein